MTANARKRNGFRQTNGIRTRLPQFVCKFILVVFTVLALSGLQAVAVENLSAQFEAANKLYDQGKFADAADMYSTLLSSGTVSPALYFNLGNAFFKSSQMGRAITAYRQALELSPRDADIRANLQFARNQVQGPTLKPRIWENWLNGLTTNEWTGLTAGSLWICFGLLAAGKVWPRLRLTLRSWILAVSILTVLLGVCLVLVLNGRTTDTVVVTRDVTVHNGPLEESPTAFKANDGAELQVLDRRNEWLQVSAGPRRTGWIKQTEVVLLNGSSPMRETIPIKSQQKL